MNVESKWNINLAKELELDMPFMTSLTSVQKHLYETRCKTFTRRFKIEQDEGRICTINFIPYNIVTKNVLFMDSSINVCTYNTKRRVGCRTSRIRNQDLFKLLSKKCANDEQLEYNKLMTGLNYIDLPFVLYLLVAEYAPSKYWNGIS
jgi:hypothetical protein